jgi:hypothetical protein
VLTFKDARMGGIVAHHRPFYRATERLAILELKAARGWSLEQTAKAFFVCPKTIGLARLQPIALTWNWTKQRRLWKVLCQFQGNAQNPSQLPAERLRSAAAAAGSLHTGKA